MADMRRNLNINFVPRDALVDYWPRLVELFKAHPETWDRTETLESIYQKLMAGLYHLWLAIDEDEHEVIFWAVVFHRQYAATSSIQVLWSAGEDPENVVPLIEGLERNGFEQGRQWSEVFGRPGWKPFLQKQGYEVVGVMYAKRLGPEKLQ